MLRRLPVHQALIVGLAWGFWGSPELVFGQPTRNPYDTQPRLGQDTQGRVPRPEPGLQQQASGTQTQAADAAPRVDQQLIPILKAWEEKSAAIDRVTAELKRFDYDHVFRIEKRAIGEYWFEAPDKGRIDFRPDPQIPDPPQSRIVRDGTPQIYTVQADSHQVWICTGNEILDIDVPNKSYNRAEIASQFRGERITDGPLPFLFGMKASKVMDRYVLSVGTMHDPEGKRPVPEGAPPAEPIIHIVAFPLDPRLQQEFRKAEVLLDARTYTPRAVKLFDPTGNRETVYVFGVHKKPGLFERKPWNVDLKGYQLLLNEKYDAPDGPKTGQRPQPGILIK